MRGVQLHRLSLEHVQSLSCNFSLKQVAVVSNPPELCSELCSGHPQPISSAKTMFWHLLESYPQNKRRLFLSLSILKVYSWMLVRLPKGVQCPCKPRWVQSPFSMCMLLSCSNQFSVRQICVHFQPCGWIHLGGGSSGWNWGLCTGSSDGQSSSLKRADIPGSIRQTGCLWL